MLVTLNGCSTAESLTFRFAILDTLPSWLGIALWAAIAVTVVPLLPMAAFRQTRKTAAAGLRIVATVFFLLAWIFGLYATIANWGWVGVALGLLLLVVGVAVTGVVSSLFAAAWEPLFVILAPLVLCISTMWLAERLAPGRKQWLPSRRGAQLPASDVFAIRANPSIPEALSPDDNGRDEQDDDRSSQHI